MSFVSTRMDADPRAHVRYPVQLPSHVTGLRHQIRVTTTDISGGGARIVFDTLGAAAFEGDGWTLSIPGVCTHPIRTRWRQGPVVGVSFEIEARVKDDFAQKLLRLYDPHDPVLRRTGG